MTYNVFGGTLNLARLACHVMSCHLSVCPSVTLVDHDHIG